MPHLISHKVNKKLKEEYKDVSDVVVHLEPFLQKPEESNSKKIG
jgi:divalent metal cation (Fe/Co/Zn/Cd) transporter